MTTITPLDFWGDILGMFVSLLLEFSQMPFVVAICGLAAVLCILRLTLYLFGA